MANIPSMPNIPGGGSRAQRAAELKAEMEAQAAAAEQKAGAEQEQEQGGGPVGQGDYVVKDGECISSIAKDKGYFWETIWDEPANSELKEVRKDPNVLLADDRVTIPALRQKQEPGDTEMRHRFRRKGEPAQFAVKVMINDEPRANQPYTMTVGEQSWTGCTDADGVVRVPIPGNAKEANLRVGPEGEEDEYVLGLGDMDPLTEVVGVQRRLNNLGIDCGLEDGVLGSRTRGALEQFQAKYGLGVTGEPDQATRAKLQEIHGS